MTVVFGGLPTAPEAVDSSLLTLTHDDPRWADFVASREEATAFHQPAWSRLLARTYGYRPLVVVQTVAGEVTVGLPLMEVRSRLTGRRFVSLPFTDHCAPLARGDRELTRLIEGLAAWQLGQDGAKLHVHAELSAAEGIRSSVVAVYHTLALDGGRAKLLARLKGSSVLRGIRKAEREGVELVVSTAAEESDSFYRLLLQTRRRHGVPIQPRRFFTWLWADMLDRGLGFAVIARLRGRPIAGAVFLSSRQTVVYKYGASDVRFWQLRPNNAVMWAAIEWALERGCAQFEFGRTDIQNHGLREFKARWGAVEAPLVYSTLGGSSGLPGTGRAGALLGKVIRRSPPIVCRSLGELLYRHFA